MADLTIDTNNPVEWVDYTGSNTKAQSRTPVTTLDQDDFFKLLVAQMTTQDPMKPMEDMQFFSQLSQFSSLEQNKAMQANMAVMQANSMLGHAVQVKAPDGSTRVGTVSEVQLMAGTPKLIVNGERYGLENVESVRTASVNNNNPELVPTP